MFLIFWVIDWLVLRVNLKIEGGKILTDID